MEGDEQNQEAFERKLEKKNVREYGILAAVNLEKFKLNNCCVHPFKYRGFSCRGKMNSFHISRKTLATPRILRYIFSYLVSHKDVSTETVKTKEVEK
jgi:hypothetical protein